MTVAPFRRTFFSLWRGTNKAVEPAVQNNACIDLRRDCLTEMLAFDACAGEFGAMALMTIFPKDF